MGNLRRWPRPAHAIVRPRLIATLDSVPPGGVAVLVAPPGSGKSVLAEQWAREHAACWISLTEGHDDAATLARDLVAAFSDADGGFDPAIRRLAVVGGSSLGEVFLDALLAAIAHLATPVILVLDDVHRVTNAGVLDDLGRLLTRLPDNCRMVVCTRWDLPLHVRRMQAEGRLVEIRSDELAFDTVEAGAMLERTSGHRVDPDQAKALEARTEGWAAGLRLAGLSMQKVHDIDEFVDRFAGDDRLVADYLTQEVLGMVEPSIRSFLLRTCVLETLSPELCDAVRGGSGSASVLAELVERGLFTTELVGKPGHFRYHQLFSDLLRFQLHAEDPDTERDCRRRAASWLFTQGLYGQGLDQLMAAGDHHRAFEIIETDGYRLFESGETATLLRAMTGIRRGERSPSPRMTINLLAGQIGADQFAAGAETYRSLRRRSDLNPGEHVAADALATLLGYGDLPLTEMKRLALGVLESLPGIDRDTVTNFHGLGGADSCEAIAGFSVGLAELFAGDSVNATKSFERITEMPGFAYPLWRISTLGALGFTRALLGQLSAAEECANAALETAQEVGAIDHADCSYAQMALGVVRLERLDLGRAGVHLSAATDILARCHRPTDQGFLHLLQIRHLAATEGVPPALAFLRGDRVTGIRRPLVARGRTTLEVQLLVRSGAVAPARALLEATPRQVSPVARFDLHLAEGDLSAAQEVLTSWRCQESDQRSTLQRSLRTAVLQQCAGHPGTAGSTIASAAATAEVEGLLTPFVEAPLAMNILRNSAPSRPWHRVKQLLSTATPDVSRSTANQRLIEPLTAREIAVMEYLPTRLSNGEIADALFISVNTLKTHLRNIYRKVGAADRDEFVRQAAEAGLI